MSNNIKSEAVDTAAGPPKLRHSMPQMVLIALAAGILTGIFFGEHATKIKFIGDIYIGLLQMMM